jgi:shikimate dehydrogenase
VRRFAGVLGWPLEHTLSPAIHNAAFRRLDLDWVYLAFPVPPERLEQAVAGLRVLGAVGANVTMPHKETVMSLLDELSGDARSVGAVNTIQNVGDRLIGHNTDVDGFSRFLTADAGLEVKGSRALVLGAGGAARAVVRALLDLEVEDPVEWAVASARVEDFDLVVNATPLGAAGEDPLPTARFRMGQAVVDLVYEPPATPLVARARESGAAGWNGLGMLVHQAAAALRIWSGQEPPVEAMSVAALHALTRR